MQRFLGRLFGGGGKPPATNGPQDQITTSLTAHGLSQISPDVQRLARRSIRIANSSKEVQSLPVGASRLGGQPDLPPGAAWPRWKGLPMSFVAQLRMEEVALYDGEHRLPATGLLSFFYDAKQETYGADPADRGGWQVQYHAGDPSGWAQLAFPAELPAESRFKPLGVGFQNELTFPPSPRDADPGLKWSDDEVERYENWLVERFTPEERGLPHHRIFGWPDQIQDDMQAECALAANGFANQDAPGAQAALKTKGEWLLLLQVDSDERTGMRWGSAGRNYYWIEAAALLARQFERAWLVQQSD